MAVVRARGLHIRAKGFRGAVLVAHVMLGITLGSTHASAQLSTTGQWTTLPYTISVSPIHVGLLRTGRVVVVAGSEYDSGKTVYRAAVWHPASGTITTQTIPWDLFCNGMSFLPDGRLLITGGNLSYSPFSGINTTTIFDPATEKFIEVQPMAHGRWYPTTTALADGRVQTFSGLDENAVKNRAIEHYEVGAGWGPELIAPFEPPNYPRTFLLPSGRLFYAMRRSHFYDPASNAWQLNVATQAYAGSRTYGTAVLLPLRAADGYRPRVMVMGGDSPATATAELIDLSAATPAWRSLPSMNHARIQANAVLLPNGTVFVSGGSTINKDPSTATKASELFDPVTESWSLAGTMAFPRLYHSTALLLADGTVAALGSDPDGGEPHEPHIEIYRPPYLFNADGSAATRPVIASVPDTVGYGATFSIGTANPASIAKVVLVRPGTNTHAFDMDQRSIELSFSATAGGLTATTPPSGTIAPPGFYMLFLVDTAGVPSVARFVQLSRTPANTPPEGTITSPSTATINVSAGEPVSFAASATDSDGSISVVSWVFPGGTPRTSASANAGPVSFSTPGTYVVSFTAVDNNGENDPSPPTVTVNVSGAAGTTPALTVSPVSLGFSGPPGSSIPPQTLSITNAGGGTLAWSASDSAPWLTLEAVDGTAPSVVGVSVNTAGLAEGSYSTTITVTSSGASGSPKTIPVTLTIGQSTTAFTDDFADGDHTDDWTVSPLGNAAGWSAAGGALHYAGPTNANVYSGNAAWTDYMVEARFKLTNLLNYAGGIRGRVNPSTGAGYAVRLFPGSRRISLYRTGAWKLESGAPVELRRVTASFDTTAFHTLALRMTGSTLNVYLDGALIITATDATYGAGGIAIDGQSQPVTWDDVQVVMGAGAPTPPPAAEPALSVTPATLTFSGPPNTVLASQSLSIANTGTGTLTWSASDNAPWLTLGATTGTAPSTVAVTVNTTGLTAGTHSGTITVSAAGATGSPRTVAVTLTVTTPPASAGLSVTPATLTFSGSPDTALAAQSLSITNTGGGTLTWSASDNAPWLTLGTTSGTAPSTVAVNVNTTGLSAGTHNGTITVTASDATNSPQTVAVTLTVQSSSPPPAAGAPQISRLSPPEGRSTGGTLLMVDGANFGAGTTVTVGGLAAGNVTIVSPTRLTAVAPAGSIGPAAVVVTNGSGSATATFTYLADASVLLADDFNDGNATGWTVSPLGNAAGWSVVDGMLRYAGGTNTNVWAGDPGWTDYMVEATFKLTNLLNYGGGIRGRVNTATGAGYAVRVFPGSSRISLYRTGAWKLENGAPVELRRVTAAFDATAFHTLALRMVGSTLEVYFNGARIIAVTDATYTSGAVAIDGQSQPVQWDDVIVTVP